MRVNKNAEKQAMQNQATSKLVPSVSSLGRKGEGTRYGTFIDWRESSHRANGSRYGHGIRDGRS